MSKNQKLLYQLYWILLGFFTGIVFLADFLSPQGVSIGFLYILPVIGSMLLFSTKKDLFVIVIIATCLIALGFVILPENTEIWKAILNMGINIAIVWTSGLLCYVSIKAHITTKAHKKRFELVIEYSPSGLVMIDTAGMITMTNKNVETLFGYTREELMGQKIEMLVPEKFRNDHPSHRMSYFHAPSVRSMGAGRDLYGLTKQGKEVPVEIGLNPIGMGKKTYVLAAILDVTERKQMEFNARKANERAAHAEINLVRAAEQEKIYRLIRETAEEDRKRLAELDIANQKLEKAQIASINIMKDLARGRKEIEQREKELKETQGMLVQAGKLAAMGELGAGIAHELNQPLAVIRGYSQVLMEELPVEDSRRIDLDKIISMTTRMGDIIDNVRAFSRDTKTDKKESVNIHKTIEDALMLTNEQLKRRSIEVVRRYAQKSREAPKDREASLVKREAKDEIRDTLHASRDTTHDLRVIGNANQLQQVFINLASNARDALEESGKGSGKIWIETKATMDHGPSTMDQEKMVTGHQSVVVSFRNDGPPIPKDVIGRIFDPFFTTKEVGKGTGLGLSISYGIIKDHNGEMTVENLKDGGVEFKVTLPAA
jgi:PAS domain S-box-containing protein